MSQYLAKLDINCDVFTNFKCTCTVRTLDHYTIKAQSHCCSHAIAAISSLLTG